MNAVIIAILCLTLAAGAIAQQPAITPTPQSAGTPSTQTDLDQILAIEDLSARAEGLAAFRDEFPEHPRRAEAWEALVLARASVADEMLRGGNTLSGLALFKKTVDEAPNPSPDRLFGDVLAKIPANLFYLGYGSEALEVAGKLERLAENRPAQLLMLANFYLGIENGERAAELAEKAAVLAPGEAAPYRTLGMARRLNFDLEGAAAAYEQAVSAGPDDQEALRGLADMLRANGKPAEAVELYQRVLARNENDPQARAGHVLALSEAGRSEEAESELERALESNPNNLMLLAGAAYRFAAVGDGERAIEFARKAIDIEPRYIWSHIALARGQMLEGRPVEAERTLIAARRYGNFPTLDHEIAAARMKAGFYRDAADELARSFTISSGTASTKIGGRLEREAATFSELLGPERRASILSPAGAEDRETSEQLMHLAEMLRAADAGDAEAAATAAEQFAAGDDDMAIHRRLFAASTLLEKKMAAEKAAEIVAGATGKADAGVKAPNASAAVMASELYEPRKSALLRGEFLMIPEVPSRTLLAILRGRIEELTARAFLETGDTENAAVRLRRAVSVLPPDSAWWRSSKWRLGDLLLAEGKEQEALDQYISAYDRARADSFQYIAIEGLYRRVNGSIDGLEAKVGPAPGGVASPETIVAAAVPEPEAVKEEPADDETVEPVAAGLPEAEPTLIAETPTDEPIQTDEPVEVGEPEPQVDAPIVIEESDPPVADPPQTDDDSAVIQPEPAVIDEVVAHDEITVDPFEKIEEDEEVVSAEPTDEEAARLLLEEEDAFAPRPDELITDEEVVTEEIPEKDIPAVEAPVEAQLIEEAIPEPVDEEDVELATEPEPANADEAKAIQPEPEQPRIDALNEPTPTADRPLFEPIVITVPTRKRVVPNTEPTANDENAGETETVRPR
ncbi:MAG TPA: tetratricopeptide repeat protein, partial [Pyrinomonadaceae bacterium]|nr:tetratricopeptide repeat protein [Pyrinomonadaceae bacterium]